MKKKETIIIAGGGISGLFIANELAGDYQIIVIEASGRWGGRIFSIKDEKFSAIIEGGAEFIHGSQENTFKLMKKAGIGCQNSGGKIYRKENGVLKEQKEMIEGWDELIKKMKKATDSMTLYEFLQEYFPDDKYSRLRNHTIAYAEGFDLADPRKVSAKALYREWSEEKTEFFRVNGGYDELIKYLEEQCRAKGCELIKGEAIMQVDWEPGAVTAYTTSQNKYYGEKLVVTVPVSVLEKSMSKASINFTPPLDEYVKAASKIGYGSVVKIILRFHKPFWNEDLAFVLSNEIFPTWWTQLPDNIPVLTGWSGGTKAEMILENTEEELLEKALASLGHIFDLPSTEIHNQLIAHKIINWNNNEWALGGYSYSTPESTAARALLKTPIDKTLFFSGEGLYDGNSPGTVEAAIVQAKETVKKINH